MSFLLIVILGGFTAILLMVGLVKASIWLTSRKEVGGSQAWIESGHHQNQDGYGVSGDIGCGDAGGGCD